MLFVKKTGVENPVEKANWLSQLLFIWQLPSLYKGCREGIGPKDLRECLKSDYSGPLCDRLELEWKNEIQRAAQLQRPPSFRSALFKTFGTSLIIDGILTGFGVFIRTILPVVLASLLLQYQTTSSPPQTSFDLINRTNDLNENIYLSSEFNDSNSTILIEELPLKKGSVVFNDVYWLSFWLIFISIVACFLFHQVDLRLRMLGAQIRIACCSLIYRKTLKLSKSAVSNASAGYVINLLSNDVCRFDFALISIHFIWILPFQAILVGYLIWQQLSYAGIICVVGLILQTVPVQTGLGRLLSMYRMKIAKITDQRVGVMNEMLRGIQVIKMYAWEKPFAQIIDKIRWEEVKKIRVTAFVKAFNTSAMVITERTTLLIAMISCILLDQPITADVVFSLAQFFNALQLTSAHMYPFAVAFGLEALISIKRIEEFLLLEEKSEDVRNVKDLTKSEQNGSSSEENVIFVENISASWEKPTTTLDQVTFNVKRGQLCAIIGPVGAGKSSLLELLLGELPIESGTCTINGTISYACQDAWLYTGTVRSNILFDEPYNKKRYQEVVQCCALNTDFVQLKNGDKTLVGERGSSLSGGQQARINLARAVYKSSSIYLLDDPLSAVDSRVGGHLFNEVIGPNGYLAKQNATRLLVTHQVHFLKEADLIIVIDNGKILQQGTYAELAASDLDFTKILQKPNAEMEKIENEEEFTGDGLYTHRLSTRRNLIRSSARMSMKSVNSDVFAEGEEEEEESKTEGSMSWKTWWKYFLAGATVPVLISFLSLMIVSQGILTGSDYFVSYWTQQEDHRLNNEPTTLSTSECLNIYIGCIVIIIIICFLRTLMFYYNCMQSSRNLHNQMFARILTAPMRFFDLNPCGRILNRFSKDMGSIDELLPKSMMDALQIIFLMIGILIMICILNPIMIFAIAGAMLLFTGILKLYLRPAQDLKRYEGITRSPVFSHLAASLVGISTIRSRGQQVQLIKSFDDIQDVHSGVWRQTMSVNTALGLWLDLVSSLFVACVAFSFAAIKGDTSSGNVGLAISQALILTGMVQYGIRQTTDSIQFMTNVERILEYTNIEQEPNPSEKPEEKWPSAGQIQFRNLSLSYDIAGPQTLKNLVLDIEPSWKIGIVGRTGAGKSSLINAIFRLSPIQGQIIIDEIDTGTISLDCLRSKISIIPQDPVLFSASVRDNLDPFHLFDDDALWRALEDVELKSSITSLDYMITESGNNFSVGQRQLICLARAILRNNIILILDEATANVDPQTDALIQQTIRSKFSHCSVLTIAHRLHTVMDVDRILVMDNGFIREFDEPHELLQNEIGYLHGMVEATGSEESTVLKKIAREAYENKRKESTSDVGKSI